jgi:NADH pyrophosphatase NudC (nudix superfamily)
MNHKTLGDIFQEIYDDFSDMKPTSLDQLENKVLAAMDKFGSYLMHSKITDWNSQTRHENCPECGTKLEHKNKERQIATWVCDVDYKRWRSYCPQCEEYTYPLDKVMGIAPKQQLSSSVQELSALRVASWEYEQCEYPAPSLCQS